MWRDNCQLGKPIEMANEGIWALPGWRSREQPVIQDVYKILTLYGKILTLYGKMRRKGENWKEKENEGKGCREVRRRQFSF